MDDSCEDQSEKWNTEVWNYFQDRFLNGIVHKIEWITNTKKDYHGCQKRREVSQTKANKDSHHHLNHF